MYDFNEVFVKVERPLPILVPIRLNLPEHFWTLPERTILMNKPVFGIEPPTCHVDGCCVIASNFAP